MNSTPTAVFQPILAISLVTVSNSNALGLAMKNAVTAQQNSQTTQTAAVSQCCALMISDGAAKAAKG